MLVPEVEPQFSQPIGLLVADIQEAFPPTRIDHPKDLLPRVGHDLSFGGLLCGKFWRDVSITDFKRLDPPGVRVALAPRGLVCYLPMFMTFILQMRDFGWFEEVLLPVGLGLEDVVAYFTGECLDEGWNSFRPFYKERVVTTRKALSSSQRSCVARYIDIAERYQMRGRSNAEFEIMLRKYKSFWYDAN